MHARGANRSKRKPRRMTAAALELVAERFRALSEAIHLRILQALENEENQRLGAR
jgi:hypothetical protein